MAKAATGKLQLHWKMLIGFIAGLSLGLVAHYASGADAGWVQWLTANITQPAGSVPNTTLQYWLWKIAKAAKGGA